MKDKDPLEELRAMIRRSNWQIVIVGIITVLAFIAFCINLAHHFPR